MAHCSPRQAAIVWFHDVERIGYDRLQNAKMDRPRISLPAREMQIRGEARETAMAVLAGVKQSLRDPREISRACERAMHANCPFAYGWERSEWVLAYRSEVSEQLDLLN